ncbi:MAG: hypothetical protein LC804_09095 [Acidobacteria bacterium]|nr:hypothetical protein [Acidobacteriota bacterium]
MIRCILVSMTLMATHQAPSNAASPQDVSAPRQGRPPGELSSMEVVRMLDAYALVQAQDALQLDDEKYGLFVTRLKTLQETRRRSQQARNQIVQELRRLAGPQAAVPPDDAAIRERLRVLREHDDRAALDIRRAHDAVDELLDLRQQARFRIFEETIERRKLDLLVRARERAARPVQPRRR